MNRFTALRALMPGRLFVLLSIAGIGTFGGDHLTGNTTSIACKHPWRGVHLLAPQRSHLETLTRVISDHLAPLHVDTIILEVNYGFEFQSHPELRGHDPLTQADVKDLLDLCRKHSIRLIPMFNCLGHQSWAEKTDPLLIEYPELDETPMVPKDNKGIYCRSWCPLQPKVNEIVLPMIDELIKAFEADAFHVGMDEVFLIASEQCPRCKGKDPAELFARATLEYHQRLVKEKGLTMLMWGDRLLDDSTMAYGKWEASQNGTAPAVDRIPNDIIICDWHYNKRDNYPSLQFFLDKGFRVWPSSWRPADAARAFFNNASTIKSDKMLGHLSTTWVPVPDLDLAFRGDEKASKHAQEVVEASKLCLQAAE